MIAGPQEHRLAQRMGELAVRLHEKSDRVDTLRAIVRAAVDMIPDVSWAGISLIHGKEVISEAPTHELVEEIDQFQSDTGEGPCLSAIREEHTIRVQDFAAPGQRWPRFAANARRHGVRSSLSVLLFLQQERFGALNLYAAEPDAISPDAEVLADLIARHATVALARVTHEQNLNTALASRDVIGQAKGILMYRDTLTGQQAFDVLVRASQDTNMKLVDVARWLVAETERRAVGR
jgi:GAF domain-containing protein